MTQLDKTIYTLSLVVRDRPGVLVRIALVFSRRGYNIESLATSAVTGVDGEARFYDFTGALSAPVAVTALGALAYLSAGNGLDRGPQGRELSRAIDYLVAQVDREPTSLQRGYISS